MPEVTYIEFNGAAHRVEVPLGSSLMRGAVDNNVPGIDADCGGECACATCHVYVDAVWLDRTGLPELYASWHSSDADQVPSTSPL